MQTFSQFVVNQLIIDFVQPLADADFLHDEFILTSIRWSNLQVKLVVVDVFTEGDRHHVVREYSFKSLGDVNIVRFVK